VKKILISFPGHGEGKLFNANARDACLDPFIYLRNRLKIIGYDFMTADNHSVEGCSWVFFWDFVGVEIPPPRWLKFARKVKHAVLGPPSTRSTRNLYEEAVRVGLQDRVVLFTGEPPTIIPENWDKRAHRLFPVIFTWNDRLVDGKKFYKFHIPQTSLFHKINEIPFSNRKFLVNISSNKFSKHPRELYSVRRNTIRYFEKNHPNDFDLYGFGWDDGEDSYPSYRGTVKNKWDVYPRYRFGVCYENILDEPGYITEKIFDCMRAGVIPIYLGASNIKDYVDEDAFIDRRKFPSDSDLAEFLFSINENVFNGYMEAIRNYLASERFSKFLPPAFANTIISVLSL